MEAMAHISSMQARITGFQKELMHKHLPRSSAKRSLLIQNQQDAEEDAINNIN